MSEDSYSNVKSNWYPELRNFEPDTPIVLVGTKKDLRDDENSKENKISTVKGMSLSAIIGASRYMEVSAKTQENLKEVFEEVCKVHLQPPLPPEKRKCAIL